MNLEQAKKKYEKVCEKIEQLNEEAFELEKEMMYLRAKENESQPKQVE